MDIDVFICGEIFFLNVLNYFIGSFDLDIIIIDYCVRGFICDVDGKKLFIDYKIILI